MGITKQQNLKFCLEKCKNLEISVYFCITGSVDSIILFSIWWWDMNTHFSIHLYSLHNYNHYISLDAFKCITLFTEIQFWYPYYILQNKITVSFQDLRLSLQYCWECRSAGIWHCQLSGSQCFKNCSTFRTPGATYPTEKCHTSQDLNFYHVFVTVLEKFRIILLYVYLEYYTAMTIIHKVCGSKIH